MRKSKFTESQIVTTLKQVESGRQVNDVCRELGISESHILCEDIEVRRHEGARCSATARPGMTIGCVAAQS
ncbi:hypothetical protein GCM10009552_43240 [Rothia nasimurium]